MAVAAVPHERTGRANLAGRRLQSAAIYRLLRSAQAFRRGSAVPGIFPATLVNAGAAFLLTAATAAADESADRHRPDGQRLAGDYFVGASVFLFERTVLAAFAPADSSDATLDAGAVVFARENADSESGSVALQAILAWLEAWLSLEKNAPGSAAPPGFDPERRQALACLAYGADPEVSRGLADHVALGGDERKACIARYLEARKQWSGWLDAYRKSAGGPAPIRAAPDGAPMEDEPTLRLAFAPTFDEADQAIADALRENGLFQVLTDDFNASLAMPRPVRALLTQCGEARSFYNAARSEAVLCYEMLGALVKAAP